MEIPFDHPFFDQLPVAEDGEEICAEGMPATGGLLVIGEPIGEGQRKKSDPVQTRFGYEFFGVALHRVGLFQVIPTEDMTGVLALRTKTLDAVVTIKTRKGPALRFGSVVGGRELLLPAPPVGGTGTAAEWRGKEVDERGFWVLLCPMKPP